MSLKARTTGLYAQFFIIYLMGIFFHIIQPDLYPFRGLTIFYYMIMSVFFTLYLKERLIQKTVRRSLIHIAVIIGIWFTLLGMKAFVFPEFPVIQRQIWYISLIPLTLIPLMFFFGALYEGRFEDERLHPAWYIFAAITFTLDGFAVTNDFHHLVYTFPYGEEYWNVYSEHGTLYYLIYYWMLVLFFAGFFTVINKSRVSIDRSMRLFPLLPCVWGLILGFLFAINKIPTSGGKEIIIFSEAFAFISSGLLVTCMSIGLFPTNSGYVDLFSKASIRALVTDRSGAVRFKSSEALSLENISFSKGEKEKIIGNARIFRYPIRGGYVYWQEDISEINKINEELNEQGQRLSEESDLIMLEQNLVSERSSVEESNRFYDRIAEQVLPQSKLIAELSREAESNLSLFNKNAGIICILCTYIKRYANLTLLSERNAEMSGSECYLAIKESLRALEKAGIKTCIVNSKDGMLPAVAVLDAYTIFENVLELSLASLKAVTVRFGDIEHSEIKIILEGATIPSLPSTGYSDIKVVTEDGNSYITLYSKLERGGKAYDFIL